MKRNEVMALIATTILMFAVCLSASAKGKRNVERGMTKQEVIAILGEPKLTSFDMYGDKWEYAKYNNLFGDSKYITVFFDRNGKVVQYDTRIIEPNSQTSNVQQPHPTPPSTMEDVIQMAEWITTIVSMMLPSQNYIIR